jgi:hypothetical protein
MLASEIITNVERITAGSNYTSDMILAVINQGLLEIAGGGTRQHGNAKLAPLPKLFTVDTVTVSAGDNFAYMPDDFQRGLKTVRLPNGDRLKEAKSYDILIDKYFGQSGSLPEAYCLVGSALYIGPTATSDIDLTVTFYSFPEEVEEDDEIVCLPKHLQKRLMENFCCKTIYSEIEQGLEGHNPDTNKHEALYQMALTDLERLIGFEDIPAVNVEPEAYQESVY